MKLQFDIKFEPDIDKVIRLVERALKTMNEIPVAVWDHIENQILETQVQHWEELKGLGIGKATKARKQRAVESGRKIVVGKSGRRETPMFVDEAAHFTGFLRNRLATKEVIRGFNVARLRTTNGIRRGTFSFGIDADFFRNDYPIKLAEWIEQVGGAVDGFSAMIGVDETQQQAFALFLWDSIWTRMEAELRSAV